MDQSETGDNRSIQPQSSGQWSVPALPINRRDRPPCHLYQLIRFSGHLDVPIPVQKAS